MINPTELLCCCLLLFAVGGHGPTVVAQDKPPEGPAPIQIKRTGGPATIPTSRATR